MNNRGRFSSVLIAVTLGVAVSGAGASPANAAPEPVGLGTSASFAILAGQTVTNTGPSVISGDLGLSPGSAVTGFPPGTVNNGTTHVANAVALQAQADVTTAYNDAAGRSPTATVTADLGGQTLLPGVYTGATLGLTGTLTLDAQGDPNAVFVFKTASTLITASTSTVAMINGGSPCNVFWQVTSSATLGTNSAFVGTVLALTSISAATGATVTGRLLARNGAVTLDTNTINGASCTAGARSTTTTTTPTATPTTIAATTPTTAVPSPTMPADVPLPATGGTYRAVATSLAAALAIIVGSMMLVTSRRRRVP
ncbi:MAG: DUF3494 domain-containing protein [Ilumatobacteraceae bacterium]|nr:DUF3494 domain-containing protein [Ilumatobacteraceae bacterium]